MNKIKPKSIKKIFYITGTRADFGLMTPILEALNKNKSFELSIFATGVHLMPKFGNTLKEVKKKFPQTKIIPAVFKSDEPLGVAQFSGEFLSKIVLALSNSRPDLVLTLGDRVEMLTTATACLYLGIPVAHVHGGDRTTTVDDSARHAITKLAHLHFPATTESAGRIKKLGEESWRIHTVGAPAVDAIKHAKLLTRAALCRELKINPAEKIILVTVHPVSESFDAAGKQMSEILTAALSFELPTVIVYPHPDAGGLKIIQEINRVKNVPYVRVLPSLPYDKFLSLVRSAAVWVGNSSGAMIESPSFGTPVVNVGARQAGRERTKNILNVPYSTRAITLAINQALTNKKWLNSLKNLKNPWGDGATGMRVTKIISQTKITPELLAKKITY